MWICPQKTSWVRTSTGLPVPSVNIQEAAVSGSRRSSTRRAIGRKQTFWSAAPSPSAGDITGVFFMTLWVLAGPPEEQKKDDK